MTDTEKGLGSRIVKGTFWIAGLEVSNQALQFLKTFYAARLLTPADFGIIGFAFLIIAFLEIISTTGMKEALIQRSDDLTSYLDTVWLTELFKGTLVFALTWFLAPVFSGIFSSANAAMTNEVVRFIGAIYFLLCCTSIGVVYFEKQMEFHKFFAYQFSGTLVDVTVSLVLVYYWQNVWALFYGVLAGTATRVLFSFILLRYRPRLRWKLSQAKELLRYGKWIFKGKIFNFLGLQADSIIVSSFYSLASLGIYQMAVRIGNLPMSQVSNIVTRIAFPAFSKLQEQPAKLKEYLLTAVNIVTVVLFPFIILIFCLIPEITLVLLGQKWIEIVPIVRLLILSGFLRIYAALIETYFGAIGEPREGSNLQLLRFLSFMVFVFPFGYWLGITGLALSSLGSLIVIVIVFAVRACRRLAITLPELGAAAGVPLLFGLLIGLVLMAVKTDAGGTTFLALSVQVLLTAMAYVVLGWALTAYTGIKIFSRTIALIRGVKL